MHALWLALALALVAQGRGADDAAAFEASLAKVRELTERGDCQDARRSLLDLVVAHGDRDYVRARLPEIEEELRRCAFRIAYPLPPPKKLVAGELVSYNHFTGAVKIRYRQANLADFELVQPGDGSQPVHVHRARFDGPYSITLRGEHYPSEPSAFPFVYVDVGEQTTHVVSMGGPSARDGAALAMPPAVFHLQAGLARALARKPEVQVTPGERFVLIVSVGEARIDVTYNGRTVLQATKATRGYARVGFAAREFSEVLIEGDTDRAWMKGLIDGATQHDREQFEKLYDPRTELPDWLVAGRVRPPQPESSADAWEIKFAATAAQSAHLTRVKSLVVHGAFEEAVRYVGKLPDDALPLEARHFYLTQSYLAIGERERALEHCRDLAALKPDLIGNRRLEAQLLLALDRDAEALRSLERLANEFPDDASVSHDLARTLLVLDRSAAARDVIDAARKRSCWSASLEQLELLMVKATRGPSWSRSYEHRSKHYHVRSDIDMKTCTETADLLEKALMAYRRDLPATPRDAGRLYPVYVFSSEAGYAQYAHEALEFAGQDARTVGLYSAALKQLLMLNVPDHDTFKKIVAHEGFHQYLDSVASRAPRWFDEGMAQYYQTGDYASSPPAIGALHLSDLGDFPAGMLPLARLLATAPEEFFGDHARTLYAESWAFVHFLRHGGDSYHKIFAALLAGLVQGRSAVEVEHAAFQAVDLVRIEAAFREYLDRLPR